MGLIPVRHIAEQQPDHYVVDNFTIRKLEDLLNGKDMIEELHRHDFYYLLFIESGEGLHEIDFLPYEICERCIFILRPGQVHQLRLSANSKGYLVQFNADFYFPLDNKSRARFRGTSTINKHKADDERFKKLIYLLNYIYTEAAEQRDQYQSVIRAQLSIFFIELDRENEKLLDGHTNMHIHERLDQLLEFLELNIFRYKQVTDYSEMMNLSVYQLNKITKEALNKTCSELIDEQIVLESKRCLLATPHQINQIGFHMGYDDISYFSRFFKKHTGFSPEAFRQKFR